MDTQGNITEEAVITGPSMMDKALVGVVWMLALVYSLLTQQILSKEVDIPCSVRWDTISDQD